MAIHLTLAHAVRTAVQPSPRVCQVAAMFGLGVDDDRTLPIVPPTDLTLAPGQVIFITGASGGGKTTLLRLIAQALADRPDARVIDFAQLDDAHPSRNHDDAPLIDTFDGSLEDSARWLALAGLNDAFVMLRKPSELSDGQRYRLRLARAIARCESTPVACLASARHGPRHESPPLSVVLADEFGATLDRLTAAVIARNIRKWATRSASSGDVSGGVSGGVCFIAATTHDDLLEPLDPDTLIVQHPGEALEVLGRNQSERPQRPENTNSENHQQYDKHTDTR